MSNLLELIKSSEEEVDTYANLFKNVLHKSPYHLKYSLDKNRPDLFMIYPTPLSDPTDPVVRECNGIILKKDDYSIVAYGLNNLNELTNIDQVYDLTKDSDLTNKDSLSVIQSEDGSILKVFYYNEWIVSTSKRIDAARVKWSSEKSFYELLQAHLEQYLEKDETVGDFFEKNLDKNYTYSFVLTGPENYHIISYTKSNLMFISKRHKSTFKEDTFLRTLGLGDLVDGFTDLTISDSQKFNWASKTCQVDVSRIDTLLECKTQRGLIIQKNNIRYKYDYIWFKFAEKLRYNMPCMRLSYIACDYSERIEFRKIFGNDPLYDQIDEMIKNIIHYTFKVYRESYIRKKYKVPFDHPILTLTSKVHYLYRTKNVPITLHDVYIIMNTIPAYTMDPIIAFFSMYGFESCFPKLV